MRIALCFFRCILVIVVLVYCVFCLVLCSVVCSCSVFCVLSLVLTSVHLVCVFCLGSVCFLGNAGQAGPRRLLARPWPPPAFGECGPVNDLLLGSAIRFRTRSETALAMVLAWPPLRSSTMLSSSTSTLGHLSRPGVCQPRRMYKRHRTRR